MCFVCLFNLFCLPLKACGCVVYVCLCVCLKSKLQFQCRLNESLTVKFCEMCLI